MARKVGRPRKNYAPGERPTVVSVSVPEGLVSAIPETSNLSREFSLYLQLRYGGKGKEEIELKIIRDQINELENKLSALRAQEELIIERMKKEEEEKRAIKFQQDAIAHYLRMRIINTVESRTFYDLDEQVSVLRHNAGIIISKSDLLNAIRTAEEDPSKLEQGSEFLTEYKVSLTPDCQKKPWWNLIMEDFRKFKEGTL
jgi:predicted transcriptional regulator